MAVAAALARWPRSVAPWWLHSGSPWWPHSGSPWWPHSGSPGWPWAPRRGAGHNRWSKVRHVKGPRDAERGRAFQRLATLLRAAAREGGPDPALNPQLANAVAQCRAHNMPKASIAAAIAAAERPPGGARRLWEARGPGGAAILVEIVTDHPRRTLRELRALLALHGGVLWEAPRGGFEEKGVVRVGPCDARGVPLSMEGALEAALGAGATDVEPDPDGEGLQFLCEPGALDPVRRSLAAAGLRPLGAAVELVPRGRAALPGGAQEPARRLLRALGAWPGVARLRHNIRWTQ